MAIQASAADSDAPTALPNSGSATIASVSASATFFATPITNSTKPRDRFSHIAGRRGSSRN